MPNSRGNLRTVKIYTVILVYQRTLKVYVVHTVINWCALSCFICVCISLN